MENYINTKYRYSKTYGGNYIIQLICFFPVSQFLILRRGNFYFLQNVYLKSQKQKSNLKRFN